MSTPWFTTLLLVLALIALAGWFAISLYNRRVAQALAATAAIALWVGTVVLLLAWSSFANEELLERSSGLRVTDSPWSLFNTWEYNLPFVLALIFGVAAVIAWGYHRAVLRGVLWLPIVRSSVRARILAGKVSDNETTRSGISLTKQPTIE